jgi:gliding motility-associated-like protein
MKIIANTKIKAKAKMFWLTLSLILLAFPNTSFGQNPNGTVNLGILTSFEGYTGAGAATNEAGATWSGDVGTHLGILSGFGSPPFFTGDTYNANAITAQCRYDLFRLYIHLNDLYVDYPSTHAPAFGGGETLTPGVYSIPGAGSIGAALTLDGEGDPNAFFVIKFYGAMTVGAGAVVNLTGGTQSCNVFFIADGAISVGANANLKGTLFAKVGAVGLGANAVLEGRMLSMAGAIVNGAGSIATPPPGTCTIPIFCEDDCSAAPAVDVLGVLSNYALYTNIGAVPNTGISGIDGDIGTNSGAVSGYGASVHVGDVYAADANTIQANIDIDIAYDSLMALPNTVPSDAGVTPVVLQAHLPAFGSVSPGGETINAGVYFIEGAGSLAGTLVLDGQNNSDAIFVFKFAGAFTVGAQSKMILINGARRCNVFFIGGAGVATGAISIGAGAVLKGTFLSHGGACGSGASVFLAGRLLSTGGAVVTYSGMVYNNPVCITSTPLGCDNALTISAQSDVLCRGDSTGSVTATASSVISPAANYNFVWTGGFSTLDSQTSVLSGVVAGTYTVTATQIGANCPVITRDVTISQPANSLVANVTGTDETGFNLSNGTVTASPSGDAVPYTYAWTGPSGYTSTNSSNSGLVPGNYCVTVTETNGCAVVECYNVTTYSCAQTQPNVLITPSNVSCNGGTNGSVIANVTNPLSVPQPISYTWTGTSPGNVNTASGLAAGSYSVVVLGGDGCSFTSNPINVTQPDSAISIVISKTNALNSQGCANGTASASVTGGTAPYSYSWSNGLGAFSSASGMAIGSYVLSVTDGNGCSATQAVSITCVNDCDAALTITGQSNVQCRGDLTGVVTANAASILFPLATYNYSWSNGFQTFNATSSTLNNVAAGVYTVTATMVGTTCPGITQGVSITQPLLSVLATVSGTPQTILNVANGTASVIPSGGVPPYVVSWSGPSGFTSSSLLNTGLTPGNYCATVTDANGCAASNCYNITSIACINSAPQITVTSTDVTCNLAANGTATVVVNNAANVIPPISYSWSPSGGTGITAANLAPGNYLVTVTGGDGCFVTSNPEIIGQPTALNASITVANVTCNGGSDGAMSTSINGGTSPYTFAWSNGSIAANITNQMAGSDTVVITDFNGCTITRFATVTQTPLETMDAIVNVIDPGCGQSNGSFTLETVAANTTWNLSYSRNGAAQSATLSSNSAGQLVLINLSEGSYTNFQLQNVLSTCLSDVFPGPVVLSATPAPIYTNANVSLTNASSCAICNGSLTISGLPSSTSMSVSYYKDAVFNSPGYTATTSAAGIFIIPNLCVGQYTNLAVTNNVTSCLSAPIPGPFTIAPIIPLGNIDGQTDTVCLGSSILVAANVNVPGVSVYWRVNSPAGPLLNGGTPSPTIAVSPINTIMYVAEFISTSGCTLIDTITVYVDNAPIAVDDGCVAATEDVSYNGSLSGDFTANDNLSNVLNGQVVYNVVSVQHGTMSINNGANSYVYTPNLNFSGNDTATVRTCNAACPTLCNTFKVCYLVQPVKDTLIVTTPEDVPVTVCVPMISSMGPGATYTTCNGSLFTANGSVSFPTPGCLMYTPNLNYVGLDTTCLVVCNNGICDTTFIPIVVTPTTDTLTITTLEDVPVTVCVPMITDMGIGATYQTCDGTSFTANGTIGIDSVTRCFTYTPYTNFNGNDMTCIVVCNNGICDTTTINIVVTPVNDSPVTIDDINNTLQNIPVIGSVAVNDYDVDAGDILTFTVLSSAPTSQATLSMLGNGTYTFVPALGFLGTVTYTYYVCDNGVPSLCDTAKLVVNVLPNNPYTNNNPPVANNDNAVVTSLSPVTICVICNDYSDGNPITVTSVLPNGFSVVNNGNGTVTVTPPAGATDTLITFQYVICDNVNAALCDTASVMIDVLEGPNTGVNPPFAIDDAVMSNGDPVSGNVLANDLNPDGGQLTLVQITSPTNGTVVLDPVTGAFTYTLNPGYEGPDQFVYQICDAFGNCFQATVYIIVIDDNNPPIAINDVNHTFNGIPVSGNVGTNDIELDFDPVTFNIVTDVNLNSGTLVLNANGTYTFIPEAGFTGTAVFTYSICDNGGLCDTAEVAIDVDLFNPPINNAPIAINDNVLTYVDPVNPATMSICVICNDDDPDGDAMTTALVPNSGPLNGTLLASGNGTYVYTVNSGFSGQDQFTYVLCDDEGLCDAAVVTIIVLHNNNPNDNHRPFAADDYNSADQDDLFSGNVLLNDFDIDGDDLTVTLVNGPSNGTVVLNADGTFTCTPNAGYSGVDQFTYQICDNGIPILCDMATVYITVVPDPIEALDDNELIIDPDRIQIDVLANDSYGEAVPSVSINAEPVYGSVQVNADGSITYYPAFGQTVSIDSFQYILNVGTIYDTAWVILDFQLDVVIPDGISPNDDGMNDVFYIENLLDLYPGATIAFFNRWGSEIWNSYGPYQNNWGGTNLQGVAIPDGTYFYILDYHAQGLAPRQSFLSVYRQK